MGSGSKVNSAAEIRAKYGREKAGDRDPLAGGVGEAGGRLHAACYVMCHTGPSLHCQPRHVP